ncbi:hypothetical protein [Cognaticolwellia aestuarii]|uniref:hypothetical protein n=1 Tax=Cognaticolwellia aestuarii TaxID=329993 RepID=UPI0009847350|nr:hypothetical protein [Cognaticolwellia aestuarii]
MASFDFELVKGHQVASGLANDDRFVIGTIALQLPLFNRLGLNLDNYHRATLNAQFNCEEVILNHVDYHFTQVKWHRDLPAEDFRFCRCQVLHADQAYSSIIYQPMAETKTEHFQPKNQLEILAPFIDNIHYGDICRLVVADTALTFV